MMMMVGCEITVSDHIQAAKLSGAVNTGQMYWQIEGGSEGAWYSRMMSG